MLYCNNLISCRLIMKLTSTSHDGAVPSLHSLFTASAGLRCGIAALLLVLLWLGISWAVALP
ncbi:MAG TPA: hypothetical protein DHV72_13645 [Serratia grimesii]|uniref:Uncharacterized protein n=1 Tax=Serratia grimesii TaxID=82995 RepID=A0A9C7QVD2_9GAMM|nr:hypothetical protein CR62_17340 [Serratia grimesii]HCK01046.1 hypothetical protein [Serratia grimesii]